MHGDAGNVLRRGMAALQKGELRAAKALLHDAIRATPSEADARAALAFLALNEGSLERASTTLRRALSIAPFEPVYYANLAAVIDKGARGVPLRRAQAL